MSRKERIISACAIVFLLVALASLAAVLLLKEREPEIKSTVLFDYFDTATEITDYTGNKDGRFAERCLAAEKIFEKYHKLCDIYNTYDGLVNLKTVNDSAAAAPVSVTPELMELLLYAKQMYALTDGALNAAMGSVLKLWHAEREAAGMTPDTQDNRLPDAAALAEAAEHCDMSKLILDAAAMTVYFADPEMSLDLGAIAKGYATELAAEALIAAGADGYIINAGGNVRMIGTRGGKPWDVNIRHPENPMESIKTLELSDTSAVTSGGYERYYVVDGKKYHHIINEETLMPSDFFASVTVIHKSSALADCLSTALFNSSYEDGLRILENVSSSGLGDAVAVWVTENGECITSSSS